MDGASVGSTIAADDATFDITIGGLSEGTYNFAVWGTDEEGRRSLLLSFTADVGEFTTTTTSTVFLPPTIETDLREVKQGNNINFFGQTVPGSEVTLLIESIEPIIVTALADDDGFYSFSIPTSGLTFGSHQAKASSTAGDIVSGYGTALSFVVGTQDVPVTATCRKADMDCNGKVNLVDFSIAAFWYKRPLSDAFKVIEADRLNADGKVDLVDFSIMAYYWTG
jgi:hypothetical protein